MTEGVEAGLSWCPPRLAVAEEGTPWHSLPDLVGGGPWNTGAHRGLASGLPGAGTTAGGHSRTCWQRPLRPCGCSVSVCKARASLKRNQFSDWSVSYCLQWCAPAQVGRTPSDNINFNPWAGRWEGHGPRTLACKHTATHIAVHGPTKQSGQ